MSLGLIGKDFDIFLDLTHAGEMVAPISAICQNLWNPAASVLDVLQGHTATVHLSGHLAGFTLEVS